MNCPDIMRKISSGTGWFQKRVFPVIWFGFLLLFGTGMIFNAKSILDVLFPLAIMLFMAGMGYFVVRQFVFDLCDEAWDAGTHLVFRKGLTKIEIEFTNIKNVGYTLSNPPRVTLALREPSKLGSKIVFSPIIEAKFFFFKDPKIVEELIERVDMARRG